MNSSNMIRVRFAPSPTGPLHMGGVRTALFNYLFARKNQGTFILRIEDTDQTRYVKGAEDYIINALKWCGLDFDEGPVQGGDFGPYRQSERKSIYKAFADQLIQSGNAYYAFDSAEELNTARKEAESRGQTFSYDAKTRLSMKNSLSLPESEFKKMLTDDIPFVIRFKMPDEACVVEDEDMIRGKVSFRTSELDDKVLFKADGMPTYHLANVVDDHLMEITHVIRGEEWLPSLPLHVLLYRAFGWKKPVFAHLPLILKPQGKGKLSKRDGDKLGFPVFPLQWTDPETGEVSSGYRESGYFPEAFLNMLAFLGWNPGTEQEIFTHDQLISAFSIDRVNKSGARFDPEKTKWFNHQYLIHKTDKELVKLFTPILRGKEIVPPPENELERIIGLVKERVSFVHELWDQTAFFFSAPQDYDPKVAKKRWKGEIPAFLQTLAEMFDNYDGSWDAALLKEKVSQLIQEKQINFGGVMNSLRLALVGGSFGPDLFTIIEILGKEEVTKRIKQAIRVLGM
ncbi:glutamate--tRNA ligase [Thermophagus sp. OGC60D27]|uniref:glutamate--tRNA ligase n=1 Tax=Thermophagus sp. OGC60D27 TaxID=3458415 RepID=UPI0040377C31